MEQDEEKPDKPHSPEKGLETVKIAGIGQLIGDTALLAYGAATKNFKVGSIGLLGYTAGIVGTRYGNPKPHKQLEMVERELGDYLKQQGIEIPQDPTLEKLRQPGGVLDGVESFLYAYPTQLINVCFGLMGVQFARAGMQHKQNAMLASGALMVASGLSGLLIQEKKPDPEHPPHTAWEKAKNWVQEKPLRLTGVLANLNQMFLVVDALQERKRNPQSNAYMYKLLAVAGFTLCNTMIALSSKEGGGGSHMDDETRNQLAEVSARVIAAQPPETQEKLIEHVAGYLAAQPYVHMKAEEIGALMRKKIGELAPATADRWQAHVSQTPGGGPSPSAR